MYKSLEQIIQEKYNEGMTAIEIQKYLRDTNMIVAFSEVKMIYNKIMINKK